MIDSNFMPMACEISGTDLLKMVTAAEENHVPHSVLLSMWFSVTLQTFNARLNSQASLELFDNGGGNLDRDFSSARAFEMC